MGKPGQRTVVRMRAVVGAALAALLLAGCYWQPKNLEPGEIALKVQIPAPAGSLDALGAETGAQLAVLVFNTTALAGDSAKGLFQDLYDGENWEASIGTYGTIKTVAIPPESFAGGPENPSLLAAYFQEATSLLPGPG